MLSSIEEASLDFNDFSEPSEDDYEYGRRLPYGMMQQRMGAGREAATSSEQYFNMEEAAAAAARKKKKDLRKEGKRNDLGNGIGKKMSESFAKMKKSKGSKSKHRHQKKKDNKKKKKASSTKKLSKIKKSLRPETRKDATRNDPSILEANWPTLDVLVILQLFLAFACLLYAIITAAVGKGSDSWAFFFFALMLLVTSVPSFVLIAKAAVESAIVVYSVLQLIASFFGFICVTAFFIKGSSTKEEEDGKDNLQNNLFLLLLINFQLFTTFLINWKPYRRVNLKKVRAAFADLKDGEKAAAEDQQQEQGEGKEEFGNASTITSTKSDYRFYNNC